MGAELLYVTREALLVVLIASAPVLLAAALTGLLVSALQTVTQLQDPVLSAVPKIVATALVLALSGAWMGNLLVRLWERVLQAMALVQLR